MVKNRQLPFRQLFVTKIRQAPSDKGQLLSELDHRSALVVWGVGALDVRFQAPDSGFRVHGSGIRVQAPGS